MGIRVLNIIFPILTVLMQRVFLDRTDYGYFNSVDTLLYDDELQVTSIDDLVQYVQSLKGISEIGSLEEEIIRKRLESEFNNGMLIIPKEYGMFIARKES